jgi:hypothetical protein
MLLPYNVSKMEYAIQRLDIYSSEEATRLWLYQMALGNQSSTTSSFRVSPDDFLLEHEKSKFKIW